VFQLQSMQMTWYIYTLRSRPGQRPKLQSFLVNRVDCHSMRMATYPFHHLIVAFVKKE